MKYWHMQLHPGEHGDWSLDDIREILKSNLIGCSGDPIHEFYKVQKNDIILIRHGGSVLALVEAIESPRAILDSERTKYVWFDHCQKVNVLEQYSNRNISGDGWYLPKTLMPIDKKNKIATSYISNLLHAYTATNMKSEIADLLSNKYQVILQGPPGTGKTRIALQVAKDMVEKSHLGNIGEDDICRYVKVGMELSTPTNYNSFSILSIDKKTIKVKPKDALHEYFVSFQEIKNCFIENRLDAQVSLSNTNGTGSYIVGIAKHIRAEIAASRYKIVQFHPAYTYDDFVRGISAIAKGNSVEYKTENRTLAAFAAQALINPDSNFVLIIDEINRANLSAVLGELIYALEYRGEKVDSMYAVNEEDRELILPRNLYIIGTMNTADRSVGHIDYAVRRRFAFYSIGPNASVIHEVVKDEKVRELAMDLYTQVEVLFSKEHLSTDFKKEDVQLGHSYFLAQEKAKLEMKLNYEIKPILKEYLKDGIFMESAEALINGLRV